MRLLRINGLHVTYYNHNGRKTSRARDMCVDVLYVHLSFLKILLAYNDDNDSFCWDVENLGGIELSQHMIIRYGEACSQNIMKNF